MKNLSQLSKEDRSGSRKLIKALGLLGFFACLTGFTLSFLGKAAGVEDSTSPGVRYTVEPIDSPQGEVEQRAINNNGQVVGYLKSATGKREFVGYRAFLWQDGKIQLLPALGGRWSEAHAINNRGQIAGMAEKQGGFHHPVLWQNGQVKDLGRHGYVAGVAKSINDQGQIVGNLLPNAEGTERGFLWQKGRFMLLVAKPRRLVVEANGINNRGSIACRVMSDASRYRACLLKNGQIVSQGPTKEYYELDTPTAVNNQDMVIGNISEPEASGVFTIKNGVYKAAQADFFHGVRALNNRSQYVGWRCSGGLIQDGPYSAVLWQNGRRYDLNRLIRADSGWMLEYANGINDKGVIIGTGKYQGKPRAFRLIPATTSRVP